MEVSIRSSHPVVRLATRRPVEVLVVVTDDEMRQTVEFCAREARSDLKLTVLDSVRTAVARAEQRVDIVIADGRVRTSGGRPLIECLGEVCPSALRVAIVPEARGDLGRRLASTVHQVIDGGIDGERWQRLIDAAARLRAMLVHPSVADALGDTLRLPSPPSTYTQLAAALSATDCSFHRVTEIVERDPAISAKLLQLVSTAFFGLPKGVQSVGGAVAYLGINMVKLLVLSAEVTSMFQPSPALCGFDIHQTQRRSLIAARLAKAMMLPSEHAELAQLSGTLHAVGDLLLADRAPTLFRNAFFASEQQGIAMFHAQRQEIGVPSSELGACLLQMWGLPRPICEAIRHQHLPMAAASSAQHLASALHIASRLAQDPEVPLDSEGRGLVPCILQAALTQGGWERTLPKLREMARIASTS